MRCVGSGNRGGQPIGAVPEGAGDEEQRRTPPAGGRTAIRRVPRPAAALGDQRVHQRHEEGESPDARDVDELDQGEERSRRGRRPGPTGSRGIRWT